MAWRSVAWLTLVATTVLAQQSREMFRCPEGWTLNVESCYQFHNVRRSWEEAARICRTYGAHLVLVESLAENNFTQSLARQQLDHLSENYWLGTTSLNDLKTNTLDSAAGKHVSLYSGFWSDGQPKVGDGECVQSSLGGSQQSWRLSRCESMLPFLCQARACPAGTSLCSNGGCINKAFLCDGQNDCGDWSDELQCEDQCKFYMKSSSGLIETPAYPAKYKPNMNCQWTLEGPMGHKIILNFDKFDTEKNFDIVQILIGGRTADSAESIATLSGKQNSSRQFVSASNLMVIKFKSDASAQKMGFKASWNTKPDTCGGALIATENHKSLSSPDYPNQYPGGLECLYQLQADQGQVITVLVTDFDMEDENDYILIRDGSSPSSKILAKLTGDQKDNPRFVISTGSQMYFYVRTSHSVSRRGFQIRYYSGCSVSLQASEGEVMSPAFGISNYPNNGECLYLIKRPDEGRLSLKFTSFDVAEKDTVQVYDNSSPQKAVALHPSQGFTGPTPPNMTLTAQSGTMLLRFNSDALKTAKGWAAKFSADCPQLKVGRNAISSSRDTSFDSVVTYTCPPGHEFADRQQTIVTECAVGGKWSVEYIPACQEVYCGPVPQIDNGFSHRATNVSYLGKAMYKCYAGFAFPSNEPFETITCLDNGMWESLPECQASQCSILAESPHATQTVLNGGGKNYGTVVRFECQTGYHRTGPPVVHCMSNGSWSGDVPTCTKKQCHAFPEITDGFITDMISSYHYGDQARVQCHRGFRLVGSPLITCGNEEVFMNPPTCEDMDECTTAQCDAASTECHNSPGAFSCMCKAGFLPNLACGPVGDLGVSDGGIPDGAIQVSSTAGGFRKESVRLNSQPGWCGTESAPGKNWVIVDLRVSTVVTGLRTQPVTLPDGSIALSTSIILQYRNNLTEEFRNYVSRSGKPVEFHITSGAPESALNLPESIEARYIKLSIADYQIAPCVKFELMGCARQDCIDVNECADNKGGCGHQCVNSPGSFSCQCDVGYELFVNTTTAGYTIAVSENGMRDGDTYRLNKTCVRKMCPMIEMPMNGTLLDTREMHRFMDVVKFQCDYGYVMEGADTLQCLETGVWNGTIPVCAPAVCHPLKLEGIDVAYEDPESIMAALSSNVSFSCTDEGKPLRNTATSAFRQCSYDPKTGLPDYWLSGVQPECVRRDCGVPADTPGSAYGINEDTQYQSAFYFGCQDTFSFNGQTSRNDNVVRCMSDGNWDFGDLRCEGPVCGDPGHPPNGMQAATSYEQSSKVSFSCNKQGYIPIVDEPITCVNAPTCKVVKPVGITSGKIPDSAFNVSSERVNYEARNIRLNSATGWCGGQEGNSSFVIVDLGSVHYIKAILLKGVITNDVVGRPTEINFFYKVKKTDGYVIQYPSFNLSNRIPGNYGELAMITLPTDVRGRYFILNIRDYDTNPCLKFELMGCEETPEENNLLGWDMFYPACVDNVPPKFLNCPGKPITVERGPNGLLPVNYVVPVAEDNSGIITRTEVSPAGFQPPMHVFEDMMVEYLAFDIDGNVAICQVNITVPDDTPPYIKCPQSYVIELVDEQETYKVNFNSSLTLAHVDASDNEDQHPMLEVTPSEATIRVGDFQNVTITATDSSNNSASCSFQVAVYPSSCVSWELKKPRDGKLMCLNNPARIMECTATCNEGFRFTDNSPPSKTFTCSEEKEGLWMPSPIVPDCVSENTQEASFEMVADITYRSNGAINPTCLPLYKQHVDKFKQELGENHSQKCNAATSAAVDVEMVKTDARVLGENIVGITFTYRISHANPQERIYDLCGSVLEFGYDLTRASQIESIVEVPSVGSSCSAMQAISTNVTQGFACSQGEILNTETTDIPRCLHCPAGTFAKAMAKQCTVCSVGFYQDMSRQGECKQCPSGRYTKGTGSKSIEECIPVCGFGTYSPIGLVPCLNCAQNSYSGVPSLEGFKQCNECPPGTFTYMAASKSETECRQKCAPGTYSDTGLEPCNMCPKNFHQALEGQTTCQECPSGSSTVSEGAVAPDLCRAIECTENNCQNGGLCLARHHQIQCYCPAGFSGKHCEEDIDECASMPCYNEGKCVDYPQSYKCECPPGYSGLQCQDKTSDCVPGACPDRAMCKDNPGVGNFECLCRSGYTGPDCSSTVDPCSERGNPCNNSGVCTALEQGRFKCGCSPGWEGRLCDINTDDCAEMPCLLGAKCTDLVNDFQCACPPGFTGKRCHVKIDLCENEPCMNGVCVDRFFEHECICNPGFMGTSCETNVDDCVDNPCQNGGQCADKINDFECTCPTGFTGKKCQHMVDHCSSDPCENEALCTNTFEGFMCTCKPGYVGLQCEAATDDCVNIPCNPIGTDACIDLDNDFKCKCRPGFTGELCETNINECEFNPCHNGAKCIDEIADFKCTCQSGWTGKRCESDIGGCDVNPCLNDAPCIDIFEDFFCVCPSGTDGKMCQVAPERCVGDPCMNGAQCQDFGSGLNCTCSSDYTGIGCQYEYDACAEGVCQNGATCVDHGPDYQCLCAPGYEGKHCDQDIVDCTPSACPPGASCIDLTNDFYCQCPFNHTGEDCRKMIDYDYDLYFNDEAKLSSASLTTPFELLESKAFTVAFWVQFTVPEDHGLVFTLFEVSSPHLASDKRVLLQATDSSMIIEFVPGMKEFVSYRPNIPVNDGQWHHVAIIWESAKGMLTLTTDAVIVAQIPGYAMGHSLPKYGYITLGAVSSQYSAYADVRGFHGKIARVNTWNRVIDYRAEIAKMAKSCMKTPVVFNGLLSRWAGYELTEGTVERNGPSDCGQKLCPLGYTGDCTQFSIDKTPPRVDHCPGNIWVITRNGSAMVNWDKPRFTDNVGVVKVEPSKYYPGQTLSLGTYHVATVAYDSAGNSATCSFDVFVLEEFCEDLEDPVGGSQRCGNWGPGGKFKICQIECNPGLMFSTSVPKFYTCGAEGFWRPIDDPSIPMVYPACSRATPAQRVFKINLQFPSSVICNDAGQNVLSDQIRMALMKLNNEWNICTETETNTGDCKNLNVNVNCARRKITKRESNRFSRQVNEDESEDAYAIDITFPAASGPVQNRLTNERSTLLELIQKAILEQNQFDVTESLPQVNVDPTSLNLDSEYSCPIGQVVVEDHCVSCAPGTFYDRATKTCESCLMGTFSDEVGQVACKPCPEEDGRQGVTKSRGSRSLEQCHKNCTAGSSFNAKEGECEPCGFAYYQENEGSFMCKRCGAGLTTGTNTAVSVQECRQECESGSQLSSGGGCDVCPRGTYRTKGDPNHAACVPCPEGMTSEGTGAATLEECKLPICPAGTHLSETDGEYECEDCARGFYQPDIMQTKCLQCEENTSTKLTGSKSADDCTNPCYVDGKNVRCDANADCIYKLEDDTHMCACKLGFNMTDVGECADTCDNFCMNDGACDKNDAGEPICHCEGSFTGKRCQTKSPFIYIAGGVAGSVVFLILLVLLVWMICLRSGKKRDPKKLLPPPTTIDPAGQGVNFYYGQPTPYAESIAPSHHSNYAYYDDEEDTWEMPNYNLYNETYMKTGGYPSNSLARSNASIYNSNKDELYDRLRKHTYHGKKDKEEEAESDGPGAQ